MRGWGALLTLVALALAPGCGRDERVEGANAVARGVSALLAGDDAAALASCRRATALDPGDQVAQECVLLAAIRTHDWNRAAGAAAELRKLAAMDPWLEAVADRVAALADPGVQSTLSLSSPPYAWACLDHGCTRPEDVPDAEMARLGALVAAHRGDLRGALELLRETNPDSAGFDLRLLLLARAGELQALAGLLEGTSCTDENRALRTGVRAAFAPATELGASCAGPDAVGTPEGSVAALLDSALEATLAGRYGVAESLLERARRRAPDAQVIMVYDYALALLAGEYSLAARMLPGMPANLPPEWREWLRAVPQRPGF